MISKRKISAGKLALTFAAFLLYVVAFYLFFPRMGGSVAALSVLPVLAGSWLFGLGGGLLSAILSILLNALLLTTEGQAGLYVMIRSGGSAGSLTVLVAGAAVGYARRLYQRHVEEIAARRKAEAALRSSESHFRTLFEESPLGISLVDGESRFLQVNARLCEMLGYSEDELKGMTFMDVTHPEDVEASVAHTQRLNAGEIPRFDMEKRYMRKDGASIWVSLTVSTIRDDSGQAEYYVGMVEDIEERKQAESRLRQRNRELQLLNRVIGAATSNPEPRIVLETACRELAQAFGMPQAGAALLDDSGETLEVVAEYMTGEIPSAVGERIPIAGNPGMLAVLHEKKPMMFSDAQRDPRLSPLHELIKRRQVASMLLLPLQVNGEVVGTIGLDTATRRDFTEDEVQLAMTATAAVGQVLERARLQAATEAQERLAAVGQLSAGIAHDFNNILGVIVIYAEMLQQLALPAPVVQRLDVIHEQAQRASQLVQQILDFSRKTVMRRQPIDLQEFLEEQVNLLRRTLPETIEVDFEHEHREGRSYRVEGDATRLQQAVMNLAVNARDAMPEGGQLHFSLSRLGPEVTLPEMGADCVGPGEWIRLQVTDRGAGIEPQHLGHIFEPFYTTKAPGRGSGLGLAQVYGIVKQHQGHIDVETKVGRGTTFTIYLPALHDAPVSAESNEEGPAAETEGTLLVVEDNEIIREAMVEILQTLGYEVVAAENGKEAIAAYTAQPAQIGLVISDMVMPHMGGKALFHALRAQNPGVRMIFASGYPLDEQNKQFVEQSGSVWVNKPFSQETLTGAIRRVLGVEALKQDA